MVKDRCTFMLVLAQILLLTGCGGTLSIEPVKTPDMTVEPTVDIDGTVTAAVAAALAARPTVETDATVSTAVAATLTAVWTPCPPITTTETLTPTPTPTPSPTLLPIPSHTPLPTPCGLEPHPSLAAAWDRNRLGCTQDSATLIWAAWEPFEGGYMLWRSDSMDVYILYRQGATDSSAGSWELWYLDWDGSDPGGIGLSPPPGRAEPTRGFGWVWREHLDGPDGPLGWALEREKGFCARVQTFESGIIVGNGRDPSCTGQEPGNTTDPSLAPFVCALYGNRTWECY